MSLAWRPRRPLVVPSMSGEPACQFQLYEVRERGQDCIICRNRAVMVVGLDEVGVARSEGKGQETRRPHEGCNLPGNAVMAWTEDMRHLSAVPVKGVTTYKLLYVHNGGRMRTESAPAFATHGLHI